MKLSVGGYSFYNLFQEGKMDVFGYLETVKYRYHLDAVDLWNAQIAQRTNSLLILADESYLVKVREALDEKGLRLVNLAVDTAHLWDPDPEIREALRQNALKHLQAAVILGAETVRIDTGGSYRAADDSYTDEAFEWIVNGYREYCQFARDYGFRIGPENHMGASLVPGELVRIAEAVNDPAFGVLLHMDRWSRDQETGDQLVAPWAYHIHFDNKSAAKEEILSHIKAIRAGGYDGYWAVEYNAPENQYLEVEYLLCQAAKRLKEAESAADRLDSYNRTGQN
ncbi:sugar phosphate isomerase/epimerase [Paenibacillus sp. J22TS3]|uniref:sugar phosphate isomerase/epimerase family protein n=1 Tax=Paenibacillus sp. J22TS3 TaxID=2807192 RepID=UPI001B0764F8|nr:sugar phosphate isomerase/epimerase family protein [Paenibacillus sp. J22TS3]GIP20795.1 hypothetical protein J22TS3_10700 [Paenibacillus sp. J22TS3]